MKKHYKAVLILLVFVFIGLVTTGIGVTYAYYQTSVTGAVSGKTSDYTGEIQVVSSTHSILPASSVAVDTIEFYVKNYAGSDSTPSNLSEVYLSYVLSFSLTTGWGSGCTNPLSYKLYSIGTNNSETQVTLTSNQSPEINFSLIGQEKDHYKLKLYWDMTKNDATCYAGKSGSVGISADIHQTASRYTVN